MFSFTCSYIYTRTSLQTKQILVYLTTAVNSCVGATVNINTTIHLLPNVIFSADGLSAADGVEYSANVTGPNNGPVPTAVILSRDSVGTCDGLVLDGSLSVGSASRALTYKWAVLFPPYQPRVSAADLQPLVEKVGLVNHSRVELTSADLVSGQGYRFKLTVTNWIGRPSSSFCFLTVFRLCYSSRKTSCYQQLTGQSHSVEASVRIEMYDMPAVQITDTAERNLDVTQDLLVISEASLSSCMSADTKMAYKWTLVSRSLVSFRC